MSEPASTITHPDRSEFPVTITEIVCVLGAVGMVLVHLYRFTQVPEMWTWPMLVAALLGVIASDFTSAIIHWIGDTWGSEQTPVLGPRFIRPFRFHHAHPLDMLKSHFFTTNGDTALGTFPFLIAPFFMPLSNPVWGFIAVFCWALGGWGMWTSQFHQWAHMKHPPRFAVILQRLGLIISPQHHNKHHKVPYAANYCITAGWCDSLLACTRFFTGLEWIVTRLTGVLPRSAPQAAPPSRNQG